MPGSSCGQLPADAAEERTEGQEKEPYIVGSPRVPSGGAPEDPTESLRTGAPTQGETTLYIVGVRRGPGVVTLHIVCRPAAPARQKFWVSFSGSPFFTSGGSRRNGAL